MNYQTIKLIGGAKVTIDTDERMTRCSKCAQQIRFGITQSGKKMPITEIAPGEYQSHFADCPAASSFRKSGLEDRIDEEQRNQEYINSL